MCQIKHPRPCGDAMTSILHFNLLMLLSVKIFLNIAKVIDGVNDAVGRWVAWLTVFMVLVTVIIVVLRYGFSIGFIWMQESVRFMHGFVFLLCASYTLLHNGHVRVDIFYAKMSARGKARVDIIGTVLFLIPVCLAILIYSYDYRSFRKSSVGKVSGIGIKC